MKLATAYVEISARTEEFRRQLREIQTLTAESARNIGRSLQTIGPMQIDHGGESLRRNPAGPGMALPSQTRDTNQTTGVEPVAAGAQRIPLPGVPPSQMEPRSPVDATFWKQQLELQRKELEVLQKQLEILKELRQGVPAILT